MTDTCCIFIKSPRERVNLLESNQYSSFHSNVTQIGIKP